MSREGHWDRYREHMGSMESQCEIHSDFHRNIVNEYIMRLRSLECARSAILSTSLRDRDLLQIIDDTRSSKTEAMQYSLASEIWNHLFFWEGACGSGRNILSDEMEEEIAKEFYSISRFKSLIHEAASNIGETGWVWVAWNRRKSEASIFGGKVGTSIVGSGWVALLNLDVCEHAYTKLFGEDLDQYVDCFINYFLDWRFLQSNLKLAKSGRGFAVEAIANRDIWAPLLFSTKYH